MFNYYLTLGVRNIKRAPLLYSLVILTLAIGCSVFVANLALINTMAADPIPNKSDKLFHVSMSTWRGDKRNDLPLNITSYSDAKAIKDSNIASKFATHYRTQAYVKAANAKSLTRYSATIRATNADFFSMMDAPFLNGQAFNSDNGNDIVLSNKLNKQLFGGEDSIGKAVEIDGKLFTVVGVLKDWTLRPKFYHVNSGQVFTHTEDIYFPLETAIDMNWHNTVQTTASESAPTMADTRTASVYYLQTWVQLDTPQQVAQLQAFLDNYATKLKEQGLHPHEINNQLHDAKQWLEENDVIDKRVLAFAIATSLFLVVCIFNASSLLLARYNANNFETGLKRALGVSKQQILHQGLVEGLVSGVIAGTLAIGLSYVFLYISGQLLPNLRFVAVLDFSMLSLGFIIAILTTLASSLYPVIRSTQTSISAELKG